MTRHTSIDAPSPPTGQSDSPERSDGASPDDLGTTTLRVRWLVETRFRGNRSAFAAAIGLTHSAVARVFKDRAPGRKMLEAIVANLQVSSEWLISGLGQPFRQPTAVAPPVWIPVSTELLPGPVAEHRGRLASSASATLSEVLRESTYWFQAGRRRAGPGGERVWASLPVTGSSWRPTATASPGNATSSVTCASSASG